jgi:hypothetical protein
MNLNLSTFRRSFNPRREFNPADKKDLQEFKFFKTERQMESRVSILS